ncbi:anosmin-1-like [Physella acuta]|uniref:anosmin-1-like n=1 Tax=Physella acuta TaxID=109671 RepID=UPI0027DC475A|nr:anosmin-1-like [Physella acuta]
MRDIGRWLFLFILCVAQFHMGSTNNADILRGQCFSFCLKLKGPLRSNSKNGTNVTSDSALSSFKSIKVCEKHRVCKWCLYACERPISDYENHNDCLQDCSIPRIRRKVTHQQACNNSCEFIAKTLQSKYGSCPSPKNMTGLDTACVQECDRDVHCDGMLKCCPNSCGRICHQPLEYQAIPPVPTNLVVDSRKNGGLHIEWVKGLSPAVPSPVIYVVRWWCPSINYSDRYFATDTHAKLDKTTKIEYGASCNFTVASVNTHGSRGFIKSINYVRRLEDPSAPRHLELAKSKQHGQKVDITVKWDHPEYTLGLPINHYMIFWSEGLPRASPKYVRLFMHQRKIGADSTSHTISRLDPCTVYFVQVRAVVKWHERTLRGKVASTYIDACLGPIPAEPVDSYTPVVDLQSEPTIFNVTVSEAVFRNNKLTTDVKWSVYPAANVDKFTLFWRLHLCEGESEHRKTRDRLENDATTYNQNFTLYNLISNCVYELKVHSVNYQGREDKGVKTFFKTPPCAETIGVYVKRNCLAEVKTIQPPSKLEIRFKKANCICQAVLSWQVPAEEGAHVQHYTLMWGQSQTSTVPETSQSAVVYYSKPYELQLPGNDSQACLTFLEQSKHYTVQVFSHGPKVKSLPAVLHYTTPDTIGPCYDTSGLQDSSRSTVFQSSLTSDFSTAQTSVVDAKNKSLHLKGNPSYIAVLSLICMAIYRFGLHS